jgi:hypothetical protein
MPNRDRDPLLKLVLDVVIGDGRFAFDDLAFWMFPAPNVDLPLNVLSIRADKHFEFHVFVPFLFSATIAARTASAWGFDRPGLQHRKETTLAGPLDGR